MAVKPSTVMISSAKKTCSKMVTGGNLESSPVRSGGAEPRAWEGFLAPQAEISASSPASDIRQQNTAPLPPVRDSAFETELGSAVFYCLWGRGGSKLNTRAVVGMSRDTVAARSWK